MLFDSVIRYCARSLLLKFQSLGSGQPQQGLTGFISSLINCPDAA